MTNNIHPTAICSSAQLANTAAIGAYSVIEPGVTLEEGVQVLSHVLIAADTCIGTGSKIGSGARIGVGCILEQDVTVGANAIIADGVRLHVGACVAPGAKVDMSVPAYAIVSGPQGIISGYVDAGSDLLPELKNDMAEGAQESRIRGVRIYEMREFPDLRGALLVSEFAEELPFLPKRYFLVYDVMSERIRGEHAHKRCHLFLTCVHGACSIIADDGTHRQEFRLDRRNLGVHLPPMIWGIQYKFTRDAVLLVFASEHYDPADYIRNYSEFTALAKA